MWIYFDHITVNKVCCCSEFTIEIRIEENQPTNIFDYRVQTNTESTSFLPPLPFRCSYHCQHCQLAISMFAEGFSQKVLSQF